MIKEAYCSLKLAKMLKEKCFNDSYPKGDCTQYASTHQMALRWLRDKGYFISIAPILHDDSNRLKYAIYKKSYDLEWYLIHSDFKDSYEDCVEDAIMFILNNYKL